MRKPANMPMPTSNGRGSLDLFEVVGLGELDVESGAGVVVADASNIDIEDSGMRVGVDATAISSGFVGDVVGLIMMLDIAIEDDGSGMIVVGELIRFEFTVSVLSDALVMVVEFDICRRIIMTGRGDLEE
ncbi:hypothetical protein CVT24_001891 [Panaeolus cyanescens]|uniref:Uncharacterized protein n=1 Tax=Panaeolus cyanescens TaxID=181874 RepID=A0A409YEU0_9AGAR|nr:hypothetical protein CVT24_001891 [Panaeolus cyanescens]